MSPTNDRIRSWWTDDPADPARPALAHPDVQRLLGLVAPGEQVAELGGTMSLNLHLRGSNRVLRVHQPFVTVRRLHAEQAVRAGLQSSGWCTAAALAIQGETVFRCGRRLAEMEPFLPGTTPDSSPAAYAWLFAQMGVLHRDLAPVAIEVPRSLAATWAPPGSLRRWIAVTVPALARTGEGVAAGARLVALTNRIRRRWIPASRLPVHLVHGDFRLGNVVRAPDDAPVLFDFGFMDRRPRVHDLAYSLAFMGLALGLSTMTSDLVAAMVHQYTARLGEALLPGEARTLPASAAAVMLHAIAHDGFTADPPGQLANRLPFLDVAEWFLDNAGEIKAATGNWRGDRKTLPGYSAILGK